mmetsp:Transcript_23053/g.37446  ORF Transcript_23053/g.37446 Transcript_23053/m.37446 type:complete len:626 (+) Transcript_23053:736-2613(+)
MPCDDDEEASGKHNNYDNQAEQKKSSAAETEPQRDSCNSSMLMASLVPGVTAARLAASRQASTDVRPSSFQCSTNATTSSNLASIDVAVRTSSNVLTVSGVIPPSHVVHVAEASPSNTEQIAVSAVSMNQHGESSSSAVTSRRENPNAIVRSGRGCNEKEERESGKKNHITEDSTAASPSPHYHYNREAPTSTCPVVDTVASVASSLPQKRPTPQAPVASSSDASASVSLVNESLSISPTLSPTKKEIDTSHATGKQAEEPRCAPQGEDSKMSISANNNEDSVEEKSPRSTTFGNSTKLKRKRSSSSSSKPGVSTGRWTHEEHQAFLDGLKECGREWKKVAMRIPTRTASQIRSHAQKYFAKMSRDAENNQLLAPSSSVGTVDPSQSGPHAATVAGECGPLTGSTIATHPPSVLAPSVQRNMDRIMADPHAAQREVENTLEALRERYRQLQQRLEDRRRQRRNGGDNYSNNYPPTSSAGSQQHQRLPRKRIFLDSPLHVQNGAADENSSVSSNVSSIAASRDLGNEEIIALQVLGGSLPRGDSSVDDNGSSSAHVEHGNAFVADEEVRLGSTIENMVVLENPSVAGGPQPGQESKSPDVMAGPSAEDTPSNNEESSANKRQRHEY